MGMRETDRPRKKHGDETLELEKNVNEGREKQRETDVGRKTERQENR